MCAWILWVVAGLTTSFAGGYSGPIYEAVEGFDTKQQCIAALHAYKQKHEKTTYYFHIENYVQCWPIGHDPNIASGYRK